MTAPPVNFQLDKNSPLPLYRQLYSKLKHLILSGHFSEGQLIPSEHEMKEQFGVTRGTVRHAVSLLAEEGLVVRERGRGVLVKHQPMQFSVWNFRGFSDFSRSRGEQAVSKILQHSVQDREGTSVLVLKRARGLQRGGSTQFLNIDTSTLSLSLFPGLDRFDFEQHSLYDILREQYGAVPHRSELVLDVMVPDEETMALFELPLSHTNSGLIRANGKVFAADNTLIEETKVVYSPAMTLHVGTEMSSGR